MIEPSQTPVMREVRYEVSKDFVPILAEAGVSLLVSTYQAGKLVVVGTDQGKLTLSFHNFEQAMGLALSREMLAVGTRYQVWFLAREAGMAAQLDRGHAHDDCYLARRSAFTGQIHVHEMAWGEGNAECRMQNAELRGQETGDTRGELWVVNTLFSCLATLDERHSFVPRWRPRFITGLAAEDRCHLNGLAIEDGRPKYVTAMAETDQPQGWRPTKVTSGCVIDVPSGETIARGLAMPHSPRLAGGRLWVLNSGLGNISYVEPGSGRIEGVEAVPGYTRGLAFHGPLAFVGMSRIRETSTFGGVPIAEKREELRCGVAVIDMRRGKAVAYIEFKSGVEEIFAVEVVPQARCPFISGPTPTDDDATAVWMVPRMEGGESQVSSSKFQVKDKPSHSPLTTHHSLSVPRSAEEWNEYGGKLMEAGQYEGAAAAYRRAIEVKPSLGGAWANLAFLTADRGQTEAGRQLYAEAYRHQPSPQLRIVEATVLPPIFRDGEHVREARRRFAEEVGKLVADGVKMDPTRTTTPSYFFLAYQGENDRELMGELARLAPGREGPGFGVQGSGSRGQRSEVRGQKAKRVRIGFLSQYLCDHTIGKLNVGIIEELDRERFELVVLATGTREDEITQRIRKAADRYVAVPHEIPAALAAVEKEELDILHYPDIGMAPFTYGIAHTRLAPVQTVTWGHPVTSGLPVIDYFISCEHGETKESEEHYTERLVRLSRLNVCLERPKRSGTPRGRGHFRLADEAHVYACPQMLFKFHPDFDAALAGILRGDPKAVIVTLDAKYPEWKQLLIERWKRTMPDVAERIVFLPKMPREDFLELLAVSDVMLDPFPFGGGHTSYESLSLGLPVVTLPGRFLRGRLAYAMYEQMGYRELLATDTAEYVKKALQLGTDAAENQAARKAILEGCGVLFDDWKIVRELEEFWEHAARQA